MEGVPAEERIIEGFEKIWHNGRAVGWGSFKFVVTNEKYIKQTQAMVRTEFGTTKYSSIIFKGEMKKKIACKDIE